MPSVLIYSGSLYVWNKLFNFHEKRNLVPWLLFLFCPFVIVYSSFFLPYSLLIICSLINFYTFEKVELEISKKSLVCFFMSSVLLIFTHYYGALQVFLLCGYLVFKSRNKKISALLALVTISLVAILLTTTDFINDFSTVHSYRKIPGIVDVLGEINLLLGGLYTAIILLFLLVIKKKWAILKSREVIFILGVLGIAFFKSVVISPSLEARYLLIIIYPLYSLFRDIQVKFISIILIATCFASLFILLNKFSPSFVLNYSDIPKDGKLTALVITPCPKYYFMERNYICMGAEGERLLKAFDMALIHADHMENIKKTAPQLQCILQKKGLYLCKIPTLHF